MTDFEKLQAKFFDEDLSPEEAETLAQRLENDSVASGEFLSLYAVDRLLTVKLGPRDAEAAQAILSQIQREQAPFVQEVLREIKHGEVPHPYAPAPARIRGWLKRLFVWPRWGMAGAAALLAVLFAVGFWPPVGEPVIAAASKAHLFVHGSGAAIEIKPGQRLGAGDLLKADPGGSATITFGQEPTQLVLGESSELKLLSLSRGKRLELRLGKLDASVARQRALRPMIVKTPTAEARVLGTKFILTVTTNSTRLDVAKGAVRLTRASDGARVDVSADHYAVVAANYELATLAATRGILWEHWTNVPGVYQALYLRSDPRYPDQPSKRQSLDRFEIENQGTNYGARVHGYLHPPVTGKYTFWIAADDGAELNLSRDKNPESKKQIGYARKTAAREWTNHQGQKSQPLTLVAGRTYYIEALLKQSTGSDHLAVAWEVPGREREIISGEFLSPFTVSKTK